MRLQAITQQTNQPKNNSKGKNVDFKAHFEILVVNPNEVLIPKYFASFERVMEKADFIKIFFSNMLKKNEKICMDPTTMDWQNHPEKILMEISTCSSKNSSSIHIFTDNDLNEYKDLLQTHQDAFKYFRTSHTKETFKVGNIFDAIEVLEKRIAPKLGISVDEETLDPAIRHINLVADWYGWLAKVAKTKQWLNPPGSPN